MPVLATYRHPKAISFHCPRWLVVSCRQFKFNQVHSNMNRANRLLPLALLALLSAGACQKPEQPKPDPKQAISIPTQSQAVFNNGISFQAPSGQNQNQPQTQTVTFTTTESWTSSVTDTKSSTWLTVEPSSGGAGTVNMTVKAQPNTTDNERTATVTIKSGSATKSFTVTQAAKPAEPIAVTSVELNKTELALNEGASETLVATVKPDDATDKNVSWSTSNANVATVDNGKVTAVTAGSATITAKAGDVSASCVVTVTGVSITVSPASLSFLATGGTKQLQITCNGDWSVSGTPDWCTLSSTSGSGNATIQLTASANSNAQRTAQLNFTCSGKTATVAFTQNGGGWQNMRFVHKSLLMFFTSIWCPWSNYMNQSIHMADALVGDKYLRVDVHGRGIGNEMSESPIDFPAAPQLEGLYYSATPSGIIDYRIRLSNWADLDGKEDRHLVKETLVSAIRQQEQLYPAATGIAFSSTISGRSLSVTGKVYAHLAETYKLSVYLLEDSVEYLDEWSGNSFYYDNVLRKSLSETLGDEFSIPSQNAVYDFQYNVTIPEDYKIDNLSILVFVQRKYGSQTIVRDANFGDYYIDNCRKAKVGTVAELELLDSIAGNGNEGYNEGSEITF